MREHDEKSNVSHFRTAHRFFCQDGQWWFSTREGEEGPFNSREHAENARDRYVDSIQMMEKIQREQEDKKAEAAEKRPDPGIWDRQIDAL